MRAAPLLICVGLAAALGGGLWLFPHDPPPTPAPARPVEAHPIDTRPPDLARLEPPRQLPVEPAVEVPIVAVDPETGRPFALTEIEWEMEFDDARPDGSRGTTDENGRLVARVARVPRSVRVRVGAGGEWARWDRRKDAALPPSIVLAPKPRFGVQVIGAGGPVAGVEVGINYRMQQNESTCCTATTAGPQGIAEFDGALLRGLGDAETYATVMTPLPAPVRVPLRLDRPPSAPIQIRLPATGTVTVHLTDAAGRPWADPAQVSIFAAPGTAATGATYVMSRGGVATFPVVGAGVALDGLAFPQPPDGSAPGTQPIRFVSTRFQLAGPSGAGATADVRVRVGVPRPVATGRLVGSDGRPIAGHGISGQMAGATSAANGLVPLETATTDAEGRFRLAFDAEVPEENGMLRLSCSGTADGGPAPEREIVQVPWRRGSGGTLDVGDVALRDDPGRATPIVAGRLVVPGSLQFMGGWVWVARRANDHWDLLDALRADADQEGRFQVRGPLPADERLWLVGEAQGAVFDSPVEFRPGATDVAVRLVPTGGLGGSVLLPPGVDAIWAVLVTVEGDVVSRGGLGDDGRGTASAGWNGTRFWCDKLRPGRASVVIRAPGREEPLARIDGIEIEAGAWSEDARLAKIDLRRLVDATTIRVAGEDGQPLAGARVWSRPVLPPDSRDVSWAQGLSDASGTVRRARFGGELDVVAMAPGCAAAGVRCAGPDAKLVLRPAKPSAITVRLASSVEPPGPALVLEARLVWCGPAERPSAPDTTDPRTIEQIATKPIGPASPASFGVTSPGRWQAMLVVKQGRPSGGHGQGLIPLHSTEVVVGETAKNLEIVVEVDPEKYAAVCRDLSK